MTVYITARHMSGGTDHQHIASVRWTNRADGSTGQNTTAGMVDWIDNKNGDARVANGTSYVEVHVVEASPKYLRTKADGKWTDNLLALPTY